MNLTGNISMRLKGAPLTFSGDMEWKMTTTKRERKLDRTGKSLGDVVTYEPRTLKGKFAHRADVSMREIENMEEGTLTLEDEGTGRLYILTGCATQEVGGLDSDGMFEWTIVYDDYDETGAET